jgi:hypothetical protein
LTLKDGSQLDFPYQENNLPLMLTDEHFTRKVTTVGLTFEDATAMATMDVTEEMNQNPTAPQRELMLWHPKWAHCDLGRVQTLLAIHQDASSPHVIPGNTPRPHLVCSLSALRAVSVILDALQLRQLKSWTQANAI